MDSFAQNGRFTRSTGDFWMPTLKQDSRSSEPPRLFAVGNTLPFILVTALFLFWGVPSNMNDILIKQFMKSFEITRFRAGLIQSAFYMGYFLLAVPSALVMRKYGYKVGLVIGLFLYSAGTFLFWPAAYAQKYGFFLFALFVIASGAAFLETGANSFIALLGDPRTSERRLNFSQAFNPLGAVTGVLVGTIFIFSGVELKGPQIAALKSAGTYDAYLRTETLRVVTPYLVLGTVIFIWALLIIKTRFPKVAEESEPDGTQKHVKAADLKRSARSGVPDCLPRPGFGVDEDHVPLATGLCAHNNAGSHKVECSDLSKSTNKLKNLTPFRHFGKVPHRTTSLKILPTHGPPLKWRSLLFRYGTGVRVKCCPDVSAPEEFLLNDRHRAESV